MSTNIGAFRSGTDALLLAAYAFRHKAHTRNFMELGCGDGLATYTLAHALYDAHGQKVRALGVDIQEQALALTQKRLQDEAVSSKTQNIELHFGHVDMAQKKNFRALCTERHFVSLPCVIANPPYYKGGRPSPQAPRNRALHQENSEIIDIFCRCARESLQHHGWFFSIYSAEHMLDMSLALQKYGFGLRSMLAVHSRPEKAARWVLLAAQKEASHALQIEPSLCLYARKKGENLSRAALSFCPWMQ